MQSCPNENSHGGAKNFHEIVEGIPREEAFKIAEAISSGIIDFLRISQRSRMDRRKEFPKEQPNYFPKEILEDLAN